MCAFFMLDRAPLLTEKWTIQSFRRKYCQRKHEKWISTIKISRKCYNIHELIVVVNQKLKSNPKLLSSQRARDYNNNKNQYFAQKIEQILCLKAYSLQASCDMGLFSHILHFNHKLPIYAKYMNKSRFTIISTTFTLFTWYKNSFAEHIFTFWCISKIASDLNKSVACVCERNPICVPCGLVWRRVYGFAGDVGSNNNNGKRSRG